MSLNQEASLQFDYLLLSLILIVLLDFATNNSICKDSSIILLPKEDAEEITYHSWVFDTN